MPELGIPPGLVSAEPHIEVDGQDQPALAAGLLSLLVEETTDGFYRCEARFGNWGTKGGQPEHLYLDRQLLDFGKPLTVRLGVGDSEGEVFRGRISGLEAQYGGGSPPALVVLAEDRFQDLRMTRRTRTFNDVSDADLIRQIANEHGLTPDINLSGLTHKVLAQVNQSDLAFVRERGRAIDAELWMEGSKLVAKLHDARPQKTLQLSYQDQLRSFNVLADLSHQRTSVAASGWDVAGKKALKYEATDQAIRSELGSDQSGAAILQAQLGTRKEVLVHTVPLTSSEVQAEAESFFKLNARRFVVGHGVAEVDTQLRAGNLVELLNLGKLFSGKYYLNEVRHLFDARGIRTEFCAERAGISKV
jgi:phage protein D